MIRRLFLSTLSLRRATNTGKHFKVIQIFLSTLSLRRATLRVLDGSKSSIISIHALLAESDNRDITNGERKKNISIHALLAESDQVAQTYRAEISDFYPRSPCGERRHLSTYRNQGRHFYPRSPCGERPQVSPDTSSTQCISIHALLAESDLKRSRLWTADHYFYPRSPCGERHLYNFKMFACVGISIHALLAESDREN